MSIKSKIKAHLRPHAWRVKELRNRREEAEYRRVAEQHRNRQHNGDRRPNILLISIDSMGAKHLGCYGYGRPTTPFIDQLAGSGVLFDNVITQANWTKPALASMLTGLGPAIHKTDSRGEGGDRVDGIAAQQANVLAERFRTVAQEFRDFGYYTAGFSDGGYAHSFFGFSRGFEQYDNEGGGITSCGYRLLRSMLEHSDQPFFGFIHAWDSHFPYMDRPPYNSMFGKQRCNIVLDSATRIAINEGRRPISDEEVQFLRNLFDGAVRYVDDQLRALFAELKQLGLLENTIVAITADHGEAFCEHGVIEHTECIYQEVLRVPLVMVGPGLPKGLRIPSQVRTIDIAPTLLTFGSISPQAQMQGTSLDPWIRGFASHDLIAVTETERGGRQLAISDGRAKLIFKYGQDKRELYAIDADPAELHDLYGKNDFDRARLEDELKNWEREVSSLRDAQEAVAVGVDSKEMSPEVVQRLQDLGYLE